MHRKLGSREVRSSGKNSLAFRISDSSPSTNWSTWPVCQACFALSFHSSPWDKAEWVSTELLARCVSKPHPEIEVRCPGFNSLSLIWTDWKPLRRLPQQLTPAMHFRWSHNWLEWLLVKRLMKKCFWRETRPTFCLPEEPHEYWVSPPYKYGPLTSGTSSLLTCCNISWKGTSSLTTNLSGPWTNLLIDDPWSSRAKLCWKVSSEGKADSCSVFSKVPVCSQKSPIPMRPYWKGWKFFGWSSRWWYSVQQSRPHLLLNLQRRAACPSFRQWKQIHFPEWVLDGLRLCSPWSSGRPTENVGPGKSCIPSDLSIWVWK